MTGPKKGLIAWWEKLDRGNKIRIPCDICGSRIEQGLMRKHIAWHKKQR